MNIEKTLISAIIALGVAGSAALAAGGKAEFSDIDAATATARSDDCINGGVFAVHAFDSHNGALDL